MSPATAVIRRELLWIVFTGAAGVLLLPLLIWLAGSRGFGPYAAGDLSQFMDHFFSALAQGSSAFWIVVAGPYACTLLLRVLFLALRSVRALA